MSHNEFDLKLDEICKEKGLTQIDKEKINKILELMDEAENLKKMKERII